MTATTNYWPFGCRNDIQSSSYRFVQFFSAHSDLKLGTFIYLARRWITPHFVCIFGASSHKLKCKGGFRTVVSTIKMRFSTSCNLNAAKLLFRAIHLLTNVDVIWMNCVPAALLLFHRPTFVPTLLAEPAVFSDLHLRRKSRVVVAIL
jgi:hypothetical protein